jgi:hypothetical protein
LLLLPKSFLLSNEEPSILESVAVKENVMTTKRSSSMQHAASDELFQLGAWIAGLESFLSGSGLTLGDRGAVPTFDDRIRELRIARGALQRCSRLAFRLMMSNEAADDLSGTDITVSEIHELAASLRDPLLLAESLNRSERLNLSEWQAWSTVLLDKFAEAPVFAKLIALTENGGEDTLPVALRSLIALSRSSETRAEYEAILPRFARILRLLNIIGTMLKADEPLKPALIIFSKVSEQTQELISYLNHRIERSGGDDSDLIGALDGASYTASIELKKVVNQELSGITSIRPATTVYARTESAHALLTESFQHILTGFARQFDPHIDAFALFPAFGEKLERSLKLRDELYTILSLVQTAEKTPDKRNTTALNNALMKYVDEALGFLYYKDTETFERFVEEILVTRQKKDLVPILHRFGAYLETLFAQVNMRAVLEKHPFSQSAR